MKLIELDIDNFGPFYQPTTIRISEENGVTIIWGPNGRGKTTILNAFRFALYGEIKKRNDEKVHYPDMINKLGFNSGKHYFRIVLKLEDDGPVSITREYKAKMDVLIPKNNDDYELNTFVNRAGSIMSKDDSKHYLNNILPIDVSRFFLFDGELLQEYESLLSNESSAGDKIKNSIEKILGLPILVNGGNDIKAYSSIVERNRQQAMQDDQQGSKFTETYKSILDEIEAHQKIIEENKAEINRLFLEQNELERKMRNSERVREWLNTLEKAKEKIKENEVIITTRQNEIKKITKEAWKFNLKNQIDSAKNKLNNQIENLKLKEVDTAVSKSLLEMINVALKDCQCPLCTQALNQKVIPLLESRKTNMIASENNLTKEEKNTLSDLELQLNTLSQIQIFDYTDHIRTLISEINNSLTEISDSKQIVENCLNDLDKAEYKEAEYEDVLKLPSEYANVIKKIDNLSQGNDDELDIVKDLIKRRDKIKKSIDLTSSSDLAVWSKRADACDDIIAIFRDGIEMFSKILKNSVQQDASELFGKISNDKDYIGLEINDNYGLHIIHRTGQKVPMRSAGYEHIVALSLIYALHKNAPFKGPIIMDSPYGRLDVDHKRNITKILPCMAEQILLLMYEGEITRDDLKDSLNNNLIKEYQLVRLSSFETKVE